jgi:hypothetical protein
MSCKSNCKDNCNEITILNICEDTISLQLSITASSTTFFCPNNQQIFITFTVTNIGTLDVEGKIKIWSPQFGNITVTEGWLAAGASETVVLPYTISVCDCKYGRAIISGQASLKIDKCRTLVSNKAEIELTRVIVVP